MEYRTLHNTLVPELYTSLCNSRCLLCCLLLFLSLKNTSFYSNTPLRSSFLIFHSQKGGVRVNLTVCVHAKISCVESRESKIQGQQDNSTIGKKKKGVKGVMKLNMLWCPKVSVHGDPSFFDELSHFHWRDAPSRVSLISWHFLSQPKPPD